MRAALIPRSLAVLLAAAPVLAIAADGLALPELSRWQGRMALGTASMETGVDPAAAGGFSLMGDYYFLDRSTAGAPGAAGGFRATSGVVSGARPTLWAGTPGLRPQRGGIGVGRQTVATEPGDGTMPYLGVGYTGLAAKQRFSFSADVGVLAMKPSVPLGRGTGTPAPGFDEFVRELRLSPVVQLGVSYSF